LCCSRISRRPDKGELHCPPNDPEVWDAINSQTVAIDGYEIRSNLHFSFVDYDTSMSKIHPVVVRPGMEAAIEDLNNILT